METEYFRVSKKQYCHISSDRVFLFYNKTPNLIPLEHTLSEAWGIASILNYIFFIFLFFYTAISVSHYEAHFFVNPLNYAALFLLFLSLKRIVDGLNSSTSPSILRSKIKKVYFKTPFYSYPRVVIYFEGPSGKILKREIQALYKQEAMQALSKSGLWNNSI